VMDDSMYRAGIRVRSCIDSRQRLGVLLFP